jgi:hypothetical protein
MTSRVHARRSSRPKTMASVQGQADHQVGLTVMLGKHKSPDRKWNGAAMT